MNLRTGLISVALWLNNLHRRVLAMVFGIVGPRTAYTVSERLGLWLYDLLTPLRERSETQCRAALDREPSDEQVVTIARRSFVHRVWNITDLLLADRLLHRTTWGRYCEGLPLTHLSRLLDAQRCGRPVILLSAYYGPFDLLPVFLGFAGVRAGVVYRAHLNADFDAYRRRVRARSGCELVPVERAAVRLPQILEAGGTVAIIADHHAERRGMPVTFMGLPTMAVRSVGLLAWRYRADVAIAGIRRLHEPFRFEIDVADTIVPEDWECKDDVVRYITERYLRALESIVRTDPRQYMWAGARWGKDLARRLTRADEPVDVEA